MKNKLHYLLLALLLYSCYDERNPFKLVSAAYLPTEYPRPRASVPANGEDLLEIKVYFPLGADTSKMKVNFITKEGVFTENGKTEYSSSEVERVFKEINGDIKLDSIFISAHLKSTVNEIEFPVFVEAPDIDWKRDIKITFTKAYPQSITTDKNKFAVIAGYKDEIQLLANVKAKKGLPSKGTPVEFIIEPTKVTNLSSDKNPEYFRALTKTDPNGQASVFFSPRDFNNGLPGKVTYMVKTLNEKNEQVTKTGTFEIVDP